MPSSSGCPLALRRRKAACKVFRCQSEKRHHFAAAIPPAGPDISLRADDCLIMCVCPGEGGGEGGAGNFPVVDVIAEPFLSEVAHRPLVIAIS
jgi:hypothetical protein